MVANSALTLQGERVVVAAQPSLSPTVLRSSAVSIGRTRIVESVVELAQKTPVLGGRLVDSLQRRFPGHTRRAWEDVVKRLLECGVLISELRPPATCTNGLAHILKVLSERGIGAETCTLVAEMERVQALLNSGDTPQRTRRRMLEVSEAVEQPLMAVTSTAGAQLPAGVAEEVASAASVLSRVAPHPGGDARIRAFHDQFVDRYGSGSVVALSDVVDPTRGLGFPAHYTHDAGQHLLTPRDRTLLSWAQQAALDGAREVVLGESMLAALVGEGVGTAHPAPHMEMCVQVHARTPQAISDGEFSLSVQGVSRSGMALTGRFADVLGSKAQQAFADQYRGLPTSAEGALVTQLSFSPRHLHLENVTRTTRLLTEVLSVAEHHPDATVHLDDLAVTAQDGRLFLLSLSRRCVVEPALTHAAARLSWPPLVRLLWEIARSGSTVVSPWAWGPAASELPFLPRVRYGRSILAPARWRITPQALPSATADRSTWDRSLVLLSKRLHWPEWISVGYSDQQLRLHLQAPMDRAVLRDYLHREHGSGHAVVISEAPAPDAYGWTGGRVHEIVAPVVSTEPPVPAPRVLAGEGPMLQLSQEHGDLPGQGVLTVHLVGDPAHVDAILIRHLPDVLAELGEPQWWFVRYRHPRPHLRLRLHQAEHGLALPALNSWARVLRRAGLIDAMSLETYRPEVARYGNGAAMEAAEKVFADDSAAVQAQLRLVDGAESSLDRQALTAASMVRLTMAMALCPDEGAAWLLNRPRSGPSLPRAAARQAVHLADLSSQELEQHSYGVEVVKAWRSREEACAHYARVLNRHASDPSPQRVSGSLLHMHHNRAVGIDPPGEELITRMARAVALSWRARGGTR
ncbi:lantibiotic dehydratase [Nocardiopsis nanhaiensis]